MNSSLDVINQTKFTYKCETEDKKMFGNFFAWLLKWMVFLLCSGQKKLLRKRFYSFNILSAYRILKNTNIFRFYSYRKCCHHNFRCVCSYLERFISHKWRIKFLCIHFNVRDPHRWYANKTISTENATTHKIIRLRKEEPCSWFQ